MEVHHHPNVEKKGFKEYFLEFIMIFLAVTMGFFAESIRENISNNEHAKLLTNQLVAGLKADTLNLQTAIKFEQLHQRTIDTLYFALQEPLASADTKTIQQLIANSYSLKLFNPTTGAISAIEKELNIKQFAVSELPALIAVYENSININKQRENLLFRLLEENLESFFYTHFTPSNAYSIFKKDSLIADGKIRNLTQEDMEAFSVKIEILNAVISSLIHSDEDLKSKAVSLIQYVTNTYNLKND
jgi:hypothetical protein